jgi:integrase
VSRKPAGRADTRHRTRHRGISFRRRNDGGRTYYVTVGSRHVPVEGGEKEALLVQAELRSNKGRGLRVTPPTTTFSELAKEWITRNEGRWALSTLNGYRIALDAHILPVFGAVLLAEITTDDIAAFIAERRRERAAESYIAANLRPLNGIFKLALRQGLIHANPMTSLLSEERPKPKRRKRRAWAPDEIKRLIDAARELGGRPGQVFDYCPLIVLAIFTGMRVGELLGLR